MSPCPEEASGLKTLAQFKIWCGRRVHWGLNDRSAAAFFLLIQLFPVLFTCLEEAHGGHGDPVVSIRDGPREDSQPHRASETEGEVYRGFLGKFCSRSEDKRVAVRRNPLSLWTFFLREMLIR